MFDFLSWNQVRGPHGKSDEISESAKCGGRGKPLWLQKPLASFRHGWIGWSWVPQFLKFLDWHGIFFGYIPKENLWEKKNTHYGGSCFSVFFFKSLSDSVIHFSLWFEFVVAKFGSDATPFPTGLLVLLSAGEPWDLQNWRAAFGWGTPDGLQMQRVWGNGNMRETCEPLGFVKV